MHFSTGEKRRGVPPRNLLVQVAFDSINRAYTPLLPKAHEMVLLYETLLDTFHNTLKLIPIT